MTSSDRSAISNAIWLCATCHKIVDDDPGRYQPGLLFEWQREHERNIATQVGKAGAETRKRYEKRHLEEFGRLSYLAERIVIEKDELWEYHLTAEVLRVELGPVLQRWGALKRGLYMRQHARVDRDAFMPWIAARIEEIRSITAAFAELINVEFGRAWGEPGVAGIDTDIVATCRLFSEMCQNALTWEECVRFISVDDVFSEVHSLFVGTAGSILEEAAKFPAFLSETFAGSPSAGQHSLHLTLVLPDGWSDAVDSALARAKHAIASSW
jgi:hypothetical protein